MAAGDAWVQWATRLLREARMAVPLASELRPALDAAARAGTRAAAARRQFVSSRVETTATGLLLRFTGPGAPVAYEAARKELGRTLPPAVEELRRRTVAKLGGPR